jgi:hypothetical protein
MDLAAARALAWRLMAAHGLTGWTFAFDRAVRRFGCCWRSRKVITISAAHSEKAPRDMARHVSALWGLVGTQSSDQGRVRLLQPWCLHPDVPS